MVKVPSSYKGLGRLTAWASTGTMMQRGTWLGGCFFDAEGKGRLSIWDLLVQGAPGFNALAECKVARLAKWDGQREADEDAD